jgi:hypothetical protein
MGYPSKMAHGHDEITQSTKGLLLGTEWLNMLVHCGHRLRVEHVCCFSLKVSATFPLFHFWLNCLLLLIVSPSKSSWAYKDLGLETAWLLLLLGRRFISGSPSNRLDRLRLVHLVKVLKFIKKLEDLLKLKHLALKLGFHVLFLFQSLIRGNWDLGHQRRLLKVQHQHLDMELEWHNREKRRHVFLKVLWLDEL